MNNESQSGESEFRVVDRPELNGGGTLLSGPLCDFIEERYPKRYRVCFEWCSGPGYIGFELLQRGLVERVVFADINPDAIDCVTETTVLAGLNGEVSAYVSDYMQDVPEELKFDLVVGNPPNYCGINLEHPAGEMMRDDLRPFDKDWRIHRAFYSQISNYLRPGAHLFITEINPWSDQVYIPPFEAVPYDIRPRPPIEDFKEMIKAGGLTFVEVSDYLQGWTMDGTLATGQTAGLSVLVSRFAG